MKLTATGDYEVLLTAYVATGDSNQSDGRGPHYDVGFFTTFSEAYEVCKGRGVQGSPGEVSTFETVRYAGGLISDRRLPLWGRRKLLDGSGYGFGFIDFRDQLPVDRYLKVEPEERSKLLREALTVCGYQFSQQFDRYAEWTTDSLTDPKRVLVPDVMAASDTGILSGHSMMFDRARNAVTAHRDREARQALDHPPEPVSSDAESDEGLS